MLDFFLVVAGVVFFLFALFSLVVCWAICQVHPDY